MKKLLSLIAAAMVMTTAVSAAEGVNVTVNGVAVDTQGVIVDGRTMVPVRGVFEQIGYTVEWDANTKTATLTKGSDTVEMTQGKMYFTYNGTQITPDVPQQIINGSFMLPLRAVGEAINADVEWDADTKTASLTVSTGLKVADTLNLDELTNK